MFHAKSPLRFLTILTPSYFFTFNKHEKLDIERRLSAIHFRGRSIRQVRCYTILSGCRLPWPPSCCQYESTPFMVSW